MSPPVRSLVAIALVAVIALAAGAGALWVASRPRTEALPSSTAAPAPSARDAPAVLVYEDAPGSGPRAPTFETAASQHRVWSAGGAWWAALPDAETGEIDAMRLDAATQQWVDIGSMLDERADAQVDVLAADDLLWVASAGAPDTDPIEPRVTLFRLDPESGRYELEPDQPVDLDAERAESIALVRDAGEALWAAWLVDGRLRISSSADGYAWTPMPVPAGMAARAIDAMALGLDADGVPVLAWTVALEDRLFLTTLDAATAERSPEAVEVPGLVPGVEQISMTTAADGTTIVGIGTDADRDPDAGRLDGDVFVAVRDPRGAWETYLAARVTDRRERPVVMVDAERGELVLATISRRGEIGIHIAPLDDPAIDPAGGFVTATSPEPGGLAGLSAPRGPITLADGLLLVTGAEEPRRLLHAIVADPEAATGLPDRERAPDAGGMSARPQGLRLAQTFDRELPGETPRGWEIDLPEAGGASASTVELEPGNLGLRLATDAGDSRPRACRAVPTGGADRASVSFRWWVGDPGDKPASIALGSGDVELGVLEFTKVGTFVLVEGGLDVPLGVVYPSGLWMRFEAVTDRAAATVAWRLVDEATGAPVLDVTRAIGPVGDAIELCVRAPTNHPEVPDVFGSVALLDDLRVTSAAGE